MSSYCKYTLFALFAAYVTYMTVKLQLFVDYYSYSNCSQPDHAVVGLQSTVIRNMAYHKHSDV